MLIGIANSYGQYTIQGEVHAKDGRPLSDILVAAPAYTTNTTFTDKDGGFRLDLNEKPKRLVLVLQSLSDTTWEWNGVTSLSSISITYGIEQQIQL